MMEIKKKKFIILIIVAFLAGTVITGGVAAAVVSGFPTSVRVDKDEYEVMSSAYDRYKKLDSIYQSIEKYYYQDIDDDKLLEGAYRGMVSGLGDEYSAYMNKEEYSSWMASATGEYSGIGITFSENSDNGFVILTVNSDSPAEAAGLKEGDVILEVDGKTYDDMELMANAIRGEEGSEVTIKYSRDGKESTISAKRTKIVQQSVEYKMLEGNIGYIKLSSFISSSADDFDAALKALEKQNAKGLVLDLRDNGGGLVDSCVKIADEFLDEGIVTYVEDKNKKRNEYKAEDGKTDLKTVVLINGNSASASEILAAAMQDNGFKIVGETSFGKGVIQSTAELSDGSALKLTVMQYFSPKGKEIHKKGITPDYKVKNDNDGSDKQLQKALSLLR